MLSRLSGISRITSNGGFKKVISKRNFSTNVPPKKEMTCEEACDEFTKYFFRFGVIPFGLSGAYLSYKKANEENKDHCARLPKYWPIESRDKSISDRSDIFWNSIYFSGFTLIWPLSLPWYALTRGGTFIGENKKEIKEYFENIWVNKKQSSDEGSDKIE